MNKRRLDAEEIERLLELSELGSTVTELCQEFGISPATCFRIKARYSGLDPDCLRRMLALEDELKAAIRERRRLERDLDAIQGLLRKLLPGPDAKEPAVAHLVLSGGLSERRACSLIGLHRSTIRYRQLVRRARSVRPGRRPDGGERTASESGRAGWVTTSPPRSAFGASKRIAE